MWFTELSKPKNHPVLFSSTFSFSGAQRALDLRLQKQDLIFASSIILHNAWKIIGPNKMFCFSSSKWALVGWKQSQPPHHKVHDLWVLILSYTGRNNLGSKNNCPISNRNANPPWQQRTVMTQHWPLFWDEPGAGVGAFRPVILRWEKHVFTFSSFTLLTIADAVAGVKKLVKWWKGQSTETEFICIYTVTLKLQIENVFDQDISTDCWKWTASVPSLLVSTDTHKLLTQRMRNRIAHLNVFACVDRNLAVNTQHPFPWKVAQSSNPLALSYKSGNLCPRNGIMIGMFFLSVQYTTRKQWTVYFGQRSYLCSPFKKKIKNPAYKFITPKKVKLRGKNMTLTFLFCQNF